MALVQSKSLQDTTDGSFSNTPATLAFDSSNVAGNIIVIGVVNVTNGAGGSSIAPSVSDSNGNSYNQIDSALGYGSTNSAVTLWWATAIAAGANTISVDFSGVTGGDAFSRYPFSLVIAEFSPASTLVDHHSGQNSGSTADPGSVTSSTANSLFLAMAGALQGTHVAFTPATYTSIASDNNVGLDNAKMAFNLAYLVGSGAKDETFSMDSSQSWGAVAGVIATPSTFAPKQASFFLAFP